MRDILAPALLKLFSLTPLRFNQWLGRNTGALAWKFSGKTKHITRTNLTLCYPEKTDTWLETTGKKSTQSMAEALLESPRLWNMPAEKLRRLWSNPESFDPIRKAYAQNQGLIVATPHLGSWEFAGLMLADHFPTTTLYRPPRLTAIDSIIKQGRASTGATLVPTTASGIKAMAKALRKSQCIGLLPDQEAEPGNGVFADFFNVPAYTMHLLPRMAQRRNSPVFLIFAERLPQGRYHIHVEQLPEKIYDKNMQTACACLNQIVEKMVRINPEQYNWAYKRFREMPDGSVRY